ncbi:MAG: hypothetical protein J3R72DRAFT_131469 [Linnemannia gamsii]|nr:MAG: hypothetical protein J3R72DRAFT_131469 [Linnemannia gamsii]
MLRLSLRKYPPSFSIFRSFALFCHSFFSLFPNSSSLFPNSSSFNHSHCASEHSIRLLNVSHISCAEYPYPYPCPYPGQVRINTTLVATKC